MARTRDSRSRATYTTCARHFACVQVDAEGEVWHVPARKPGKPEDRSFLLAADKGEQADALVQRIETATQEAEDRLRVISGDLDAVLAHADQAAVRIEQAGQVITTALTDARAVLLRAREAEKRMQETQDALDARVEYAEKEMTAAIVQRRRQANRAVGQLIEARRGVERELADLQRSVEKVTANRD